MMKYLGFFLILLCGSGCIVFLPEGNPPDGEIVRQNESNTLSLRAAEERLITALTMVTLTDLPGEAVWLEAPEEFEIVLLRVLQNVAPVSGIVPAGKTSRFTLKAEQGKDGMWSFYLLDNLKSKAILWQDHFRIVP